MLVLAVALGAWIAVQRMSRDIFPPLNVPTIYVAQPYGGMDPAQMEGYLTCLYEYHFLYIAGIEHVESKSIQGASIMKLQFHPGTDMSQAMSETVAQVNRSRAFMPPGTVAPFIMRFDAGSVAVGYLVFSTDDPDITLNQMQDQALNRVRPAFATLPGVSAPPPFGGSSRGVVVNVNPDRMKTYGLSPDDIVKALAVGILVDEATVAVENIHAHLARGAPPARAALDGTRETALPRLLAMLCILAVFIPAFFMEGSAQALLVPLALAVGFSMIASYVLSSTLVPILAVWLLRGSHGAASSRPPVGRRTEGGLPSRYAGILRGVVAVRWPLLIVYLVAAGATVWLVGGRLGVEIFPRADAGQFALRFRAPPGTQVAITEGIARRILATVAREAGGDDRLEFSIGMVGVHNSSFPVNLVHLWNGGPGEGWLAVQLARDAGVRVEEFTERLRGILAQELPGVRLSFEPQDIVARVMSFGSPTPVEIAISAPSLAVGKSHAERLLARLGELPFLRDAQIAQTLDFPAVHVHINRERAGMLGVTVEDITRSLVAATTSSRFTTPSYWADPGSGISFSIQVQIPEERTRTIEDLQNIPVTAADGGATVLLRSVADIGEGTTVGTYERYNLVRIVSITANLHGIDLGAPTRAIRRLIAEVNLQADGRTKVDLRGQVIPLEQLMDGFRTGLVIAVVVIFLLLVANFQSVRLALAVVSTVPAVLAGVVLLLWSTGTTLNIQSAMGAIMAVGVAVANAILLVTFAERARVAGGDPLAAAVEGGRSRLRAILMTSFAMIAGMLPLALGLGEGGDQTAPLGRAVVGGLALATLATLFVLPSVFAIVASERVRSPSLDPGDPASPHHAGAGLGKAR